PFVKREEQLGREVRRENGVAYLQLVIAGLDPAIHGVVQRSLMDVVMRGTSAWTTGSSPVVTKWWRGVGRWENSAASGEASMQAPLPPHFVRSPLPAIARRDEACASMNGSQHAERVQVGLENGLLLLALVDVLLA